MFNVVFGDSFEEVNDEKLEDGWHQQGFKQGDLVQNCKIKICKGLPIIIGLKVQFGLTKPQSNLKKIQNNTKQLKIIHNDFVVV